MNKTVSAGLCSGQGGWPQEAGNLYFTCILEHQPWPLGWGRNTDTYVFITASAVGRGAYKK